ncbi:MAG: hypothetical protein H7A23_08350 [Leptospiraceae bacterium]|nr:hypothetical protein [Leptospiraceae bacterium]MCP5494556.1 hypothetical protein [Leptospiraceae bacterium]
MKIFIICFLTTILSFDIVNANGFFDFFSDSQSSGWLDENTYSAVAQGKASKYSIYKNSISMKRTTCIDATKLNALSIMIAGVVGNKALHYRITSLPSQISSCWSIKNDYEECACEIIFQKQNLKQIIESKIK